MFFPNISIKHAYKIYTALQWYAFISLVKLLQLHAYQHAQMSITQSYRTNWITQMSCSTCSSTGNMSSTLQWRDDLHQWPLYAALIWVPIACWHETVRGTETRRASMVSMETARGYPFAAKIAPQWFRMSLWDWAALAPEDAIMAA